MQVLQHMEFDTTTYVQATSGQFWLTSYNHRTKTENREAITFEQVEFLIQCPKLQESLWDVYFQDAHLFLDSPDFREAVIAEIFDNITEGQIEGWTVKGLLYVLMDGLFNMDKEDTWTFLGETITYDFYDSITEEEAEAYLKEAQAEALNQ